MSSLAALVLLVRRVGETFGGGKRDAGEGVTVAEDGGAGC